MQNFKTLTKFNVRFLHCSYIDDRRSLAGGDPAYDAGGPGEVFGDGFLK